MHTGGLHYFNEEGQWCQLKGQGQLAQSEITCFFEDNQDNLWVGTQDNGLFCLTPQPVTMLKLPQPTEDILTFCADRDSRVWIGTLDDGVFHYDGGKFTAVEADWASNPPSIFSLFKDSRTNLWAGTSRGLFRLEGGQFRRVAGPPVLDAGIIAIHEDHRGTLWLGSLAGLASWRDGSFTEYKFQAEVRSITQDCSGEFWIGTRGKGLFHFYPDREQIPQRETNYPAPDAMAVFCETNGILWAGTWGEGLFWREGNKFLNFTTPEGLAGNQIYTIIPDLQGRLWLSSHNGLLVVQPNAIRDAFHLKDPEPTGRRFSLLEGLANRWCSGMGQNSSARTSDGRLWFPDGDQIAVVDPRKALAESFAPSVLVEAVVADGKELRRTQGDKWFATPSGTRRFEFHYTALDLSWPLSHSFRFKLEGLDTHWINAGDRRVAEYSQLPPGDYVFRIMASGGVGQWREAENPVYLRVIPRFWERRWIQFLAVALAVGLLGGGVVWRQRYQIKLKLLRLESEQQVETERRRIARDLHDEVGSRLTHIANVSELLESGDQAASELRSQLGTISTLVRQLINNLREVVWTINPKNDPLPSLAAFLSDYAERFTSSTNISFRLDLDGEYPPMLVSSDTRNHLLLSMKEALTNAVRHASAKTIHVKIHVEGERLEVLVSDDGCGFDVGRSVEAGHGLQNLADRMALVKGRVDIASRPGGGTNVALSVPLSAPPKL